MADHEYLRFATGPLNCYNRRLTALELNEANVIDVDITLQLPTPWTGDPTFQISKLGAINFFVGPNGSGKSRFCEQLKGVLPQCRLLGTNRLLGMDKNSGMGIWSAHFDQGYQKSQFSDLKRAGLTYGFGVDTLIILEERLDLRIRVEATLSHLFDRRIILEWDSGNLIPKAVLGESGHAYRLDTEECHGIKELLVLLTHLYHDEYKYLIIDEPELNLHPQFQSYFVQEARAVAGHPDDGKKVIIFVTHSPFMLDFKTIEDVQSVVSFDLRHGLPKHIHGVVGPSTERLASLVPRLNVHHKQLFFSDNPIFVEGILDAQLIQAVQEVRGVSIAAAGSCVIDAGGCEEVNKYLELCNAFGKRAYFLYDLDSLFSGNLRACIRGDNSISDFLANLGVDANFGIYCGQLDRKLGEVITAIRGGAGDDGVRPLREFLQSLGAAEWGKEQLAKARVATLVHLRRQKGALVRATSAKLVQEIEGRLNQIVSALKSKNIFLLPGGALEHYLPSYGGDVYRLDDAAKRTAVEGELSFLSAVSSDETLEARYGDLFGAIKLFPAKYEVDIDKTLTDYLTKYIVELQGLVVRKADIRKEQIEETIATLMPGVTRIFKLAEFDRGKGSEFQAKIILQGQLGGSRRFVAVTHQTNAGMRQFSIQESE